ncbi:type II toxin-antitoxin system PemK/MazF family toxin [Brachybacterium sp. GCM10030267]|uniref:type II toxin-antitoxin system PemK/MazF family toxin n=1 Tax=Brachybacterium sp. GCM10030267 TaxID=3273381 RepID=UPI00361B8BFF
MSLASRLSSVLRIAARSPAVRRGARNLGRSAMRAVQDRRGGSAGPSASRAPASAGGSPASAPGGESSLALADRDASQPMSFSYAPRPDDRPDPGEIVWAWVPFEEDSSQGKDRPVLVLAREEASAGGRDGSGEVLIALMLTSRDRAASGGVSTDEYGSTWVDIGSGDWDSQDRDSEVRADRLLRLAPDSVRRDGGRLDRSRFERVAAAVREVHGWRG